MRAIVLEVYEETLAGFSEAERAAFLEALKRIDATLSQDTGDARLRTDATSLFSLVRNVGSSVGISIVVTLLSQNAQINHAELAARVSPFNPAFAEQTPALLQDPTQTLALINAEITRQSLMIGYIDDFKLMAIVTLFAMPLLLLLRQPKRAAPG